MNDHKTHSSTEKVFTEDGWVIVKGTNEDVDVTLLALAWLRRMLASSCP